MLYQKAKGGFITMNIGKKIRQIRMHRHLTQKGLGLLVGLGEPGANRIAQYEMGYRTPKRDLLNKIAHALNVSNGLLSPEADDTLQTLLCHLFWLDQADTNLIDLIPLDEANFPPPCNSPDKGRIAIVINDTAFQDILTYWHTEKSLLAAGAIAQDEYFGWKLSQHL